ncbi:MAG: LysR family transcriptional regulator [Reinekea sp.]|jgi:DNA-binding transcriptional LysR family regulator
MEMTQIRYFLAVSETLNFTRAAEMCFISQPALTKGIKKLEASIGGELLHRNKSSVELSFLGKSLLPKFRQIYHDANDAKKEARRLLNQGSSLLRVGIQNNVFIGCLLPIFQGFRSENNGVQFEFLEAGRHELKRKLENHELDMVFASAVKESCHQILPDEVYSDVFVIAFGARHAFSDRARIKVCELDQERFCFRTHCTSSRQLEHFLCDHGISLNIVYSSDRDDWVKSFVLGNFGLTFMPKTQALSEGIQFVELEDYQVARSIVLETADLSIQRSALCDQFIDAIPDLAKEYSRQLQITESVDHGLIKSRQSDRAGVNISLNNLVG